MENRPDQDSDITESQSAQQPNQKDRPEENQQTTQGGLDQSQSPAESGPATDTGFVGTESQSDTSSELIEDDDPDFAKDGQGSIE